MDLLEKEKSIMDGAENTKGLNEQGDNEDVEDQNDNSGAAGTSSDDKDGNKDQGKDSKNERTFSQSQVNRMMTREKNQGRAAAFKELGIDPKDTKTVKMFQAFVESQKSDEQKAAEKDAEAVSERAAMEQRALIAEAKAEAMILGIKPQFVDDAVTLAMSKMTEDSDLKTILNEFKQKYSIWFEVTDDEDGKKDTKAGQRGTGSAVKTGDGKKSKQESPGLGARLAAQRKPNGAKSGYWGH